MRPGLYWLWFFLPIAGLMQQRVMAEPIDSLDVLKRIRQTQQAQFSYLETRELELAATPWHGQGYMLSGADGSLVKLQLKPTRIIMAISHEQMYYWDVAQQQRHSAPLNYVDQAASQIKVFRSILQGDVDQLKLSYDFVAENQDKGWTLRLIPKPEQPDDEIPSFEIYGDDSGQQRRIVIRQADGETTEYRMSQTTDAEQPTYSLQNLLQEAIGH